MDASNVMTSREVWENMRKEGWNVDYFRLAPPSPSLPPPILTPLHRIPISPNRPIENNYLDAYLSLIKNTHPTRTSLVFSCGMGAVRTTYGMVAALVVRRRVGEVRDERGEGGVGRSGLGLGLVVNGVGASGTGTVSLFFLTGHLDN